MIQALLNDLTFRGFFIVISLVAVASIAIYFKSKDPHRVENIRIVSPSLVLSLAILGTFVGILHGLFALGSAVGQLSPQQVTGLVSGLKIAFGTSVYGLGVNILLKMVFLLNRRKDLFKEEVKTVDNLFEVLEQLQKSFNKFTDDMGEKTVDALMKAIQKVMDQFNAKINDRLGEDFDNFAKAVNDLTVWQNNYRQHVEEQTENMKKANDGLKDAEKLLRDIHTSMQDMPVVMNQLKEVIGVMNQQTEDLTQKLEAFKDMKEKATEAFPMIEARLNKLTDEIDKAIKGVIEGMQETTKGMKEAIEGEQEKLFKTINDFKDKIDENADAADKAFKQQHAQIGSMAETLNTTMTDATKKFKDLGDDMKETTELASKQTTELVQETIDKFRLDMEKIANDGITIMGSKLASLSQKFVDDYGPLTDKLERVVKIANKLPDDKDNNQN